MRGGDPDKVGVMTVYDRQPRLRHMGVYTLRSFRVLKKNHAFTLAEILVAIFIFAMIMGTVLGTFTGILSSSRDAEKRSEIYQTGRAVMDLIEADIRGLFALPVAEGAVFFMGDTETLEGDELMSRVDFITTHALTMGIERNPFLCEVGYRVKKDVKGGLNSLWRRTQSPPQYPFEEGGKEVPVCRFVESFRLEFLFDNDRFDILSDALPDAVVLRLTLNLDGERESFVTMVRPMVKT